MKIRLLLILLAVAIPAAAAQAETTISAVATFNNVGVDVVFDGAAAPVTMAIKPAGASGDYAEIHPLSAVSSTQYSGSAFWLESNTSYSIRLSSTAFGGDSYRYVNVTTRDDSFPEPTGGHIYHVSTGGSDSNSGLDAQHAFATVYHGVQMLNAGDQLWLHDGTYYEGGIGVSHSGTAASNIVIRSAPGEHAVLDGTLTTFNPTWTPVSGQPNTYQTAVTYQPSYAFYNGEHLYRYSTLNDFNTNKWGTDGGYFADGFQMFARLPDGQSAQFNSETGQYTLPNFRIPNPLHSKAITLGSSASYVRIDGIEFAHYGRQSSDLVPSSAVYIEGGDYNVIQNCDFHEVGIGVSIKNAANFNTIQNNTFDEGTVGTWQYSAVSQGDYGMVGAVYVYGSSGTNTGNVIRGNVISNMWDGARLYNSGLGVTKDLDFYNNTIINMTDDGVETDGSGSNVRIYNNTFTGFLTGISLAPAATGPTYVMYNILSDWDTDPGTGYEGYPFKFNNGSGSLTNWVYLYQNTCYTDQSGEVGFLFKKWSLTSGSMWEHVISRNNVFAGTNYALENWSDATYDSKVNFDYDGLYTTDPARFIYWWNHQQTWDLIAFYANTGQEQHGLRIAYLGFTDPETGDFHLVPLSDLIDVGVYIPGVNGGYYGLAPDLGAFEYDPPAVPEPALTSLLALFGWRLMRRRSRTAR